MVLYQIPNLSSNFEQNFPQFVKMLCFFNFLFRKCTVYAICSENYAYFIQITQFIESLWHCFRNVHLALLQCAILPPHGITIDNLKSFTNES